MNNIDEKSTPGKRGFRLGFRIGLLVSAILSAIGIGMVIYTGVRDGTQYLLAVVVGLLFLSVAAGTLISLLTGLLGAVWMTVLSSRINSKE